MSQRPFSASQVVDRFLPIFDHAPLQAQGQIQNLPRCFISNKWNCTSLKNCVRQYGTMEWSLAFNICVSDCESWSLSGMALKIDAACLVMTSRIPSVNASIWPIPINNTEDIHLALVSLVKAYWVSQIPGKVSGEGSNWLFSKIGIG